MKNFHEFTLSFIIRPSHKNVNYVTTVSFLVVTNSLDEKKEEIKHLFAVYSVNTFLHSNYLINNNIERPKNINKNKNQKSCLKKISKHKH